MKVTDNKLKLGKPGSTSNVILEIEGSNMALIFDKASNKMQFTNNGSVIIDLGASSGGDGLVKADLESPVFIKTAANTISVKAGTSIVVNGANIVFSAQTAVTMPALTQGTDYAVYICDDGQIIASDNWSAPAGYTTTNSKKIGGFHYGLIGNTETVAGGAFATAGSGMIWTQPDVDKIKGINQFSFWDLRFRPSCPDPRSMVLVAGEFWSDIYFCGTNHEVNGTSRYNTDMASGTVPPKKPTMFGGNGTSTYPSGNWWNFSDIARSHGKRLLNFQEFPATAFGVTEAQSIGVGAVSTSTGQALGSGSNTPAFTGRVPGYTSKWGIEQAAGHIWSWGAEVSGITGAATATANTEGRGSTYAVNLAAPLYGGARYYAAGSGSRASSWVNAPTSSYWNIGLRAACDHLKK